MDDFVQPALGPDDWITPRSYRLYVDLPGVGLRENFLGKKIFVSGRTKINQDQLSPKIFNSSYKSAFSG
jgi:hypothetical protein